MAISNGVYALRHGRKTNERRTRDEQSIRLKYQVNKQWLFKKATNNFNDTIIGIVAETVASKDLMVTPFNRMVHEIDDYAILLLDGAGKIENWNKDAEKIKGYSLVCSIYL